jgi:hypothetical protein
MLSVPESICSEAPLTYQEIGSIFLQSYGELSRDTRPEKSSTNKPAVEKFMKLFKIMAECPFVSPESHIPFYKANRLMLRDFEVLNGSSDNPDCTILSKLDRTHTLSGKVGLMKLLSQPLCDITLLKKRQEFIRYLVEHEEALAELEELLSDFKEAEEYILGLWDKPDQITSEWLDNNIYFRKFFKKFNDSSAMLELWSRLKHCYYGTSIGTLVGMPVYLPVAVHYAFQPKPKSIRRAMGSTVDFYKNVPSELKEAWRIIDSDSNLKRVLALEVSITLVMMGAVVYQTYCLFRDEKNAILALQDQLCRVSHGLRAVDLMSGLVQDLGALDIMSSWQALIEGDSDKELDQLRTNTFAGNPSYFSYLGRVLSMSRDKESIGNAMVPILQAVGELEAYVSCARLYKEYVGKKATVSFVEFTQSNKPYVHARGFWHPFIKPELAVKNDIIMGAEYRTMILTGSNTGGKSTLLKSIGLNLLLAQTCGLCFADAMTITPFNLLSSSLNIRDNTAQGISLFKAEVLRARDINGWIDQLAPSDYGFVMVDELFNGTNSTSGSKGADRFIETLAQSHPNVLMIFATHFPQLTELESRFTGSVANYMMDVTKEVDGTITRPFKLEKGVSIVDIAQDLIDE